MFRHRVWQDVFEIHEISDQQGNYFRVIPERGGIVSEFGVNGEPIFFLDKDTLFEKEKNVRGGNPVLFPICGPLEKGLYEYKGNQYTMKQHGLARNLPWQVIGKNEGTESGSITLILSSDPETRMFYPFDFELKFKYELKPGELTIYQHYKNLSAEPMPFYAGFHPYFLTGDREKLSVEIEALGCYDLVDQQEGSVDRGLIIPVDREFNQVFSGVRKGKASFKDESLGRTIQIEFDENFFYTVFWALPGKPFLCMEPWMGNNNSLNTGEQLKVLAQGETLSAIVSYIVKNS